ncbi:FxsA family protein [Chelativorans xinjiangense]|uniref:FxsA family protein n=1 Tax=Chelativorans xinjiangense TaxID=2681485 RepID=UPI00135A3530|nr:FxsA family protein [Chelativorans xinjiangense]
MPFSIVPFLLLSIPLLEIAVFVVIGGQIGVLPTLALVLATAVAGSILLRIQGFGVLSRVQKTLNEGRVPGRELVHGVMILIAGILLLTPGFVTDTLGFLLFIPAVRDIGWAFLRDRIVVVGAGAPPGGGQDRRQPRDKVIDLDMDDYSSSEPGKSPWRGPDRPQD